MGKYIIAMFVIVGFITGCQATNDDTEQRIQGKSDVPNRQEISEEEMSTKNEDYKRYVQSLEKGIAEGGYKQELFSSDEQREIEQYISQMEEVVSVYAEVFEKQLNITVSVKKGPYEEIEDEIYTYLQEHFPGRNAEVFVVQATG